MERDDIDVAVKGSAKGYGAGALTVNSSVTASEWFRKGSVEVDGVLPLGVAVPRTPVEFVDLLSELPTLSRAQNAPVVAFAVKPYSVVFDRVGRKWPETSAVRSRLLQLAGINRQLMVTLDEAEAAVAEYGKMAKGLVARQIVDEIGQLVTDLEGDVKQCADLARGTCKSYEALSAKYDVSALRVPPRIKGTPVNRGSAPPNQDLVSIGKQFHATSTVVAGHAFAGGDSKSDTELFASASASCAGVNVDVVFAAGFQMACMKSVGFAVSTLPAGVTLDEVHVVLVNQDNGILNVHPNYSSGADVFKAMDPSTTPPSERTIRPGGTPYVFVGYILRP